MHKQKTRLVARGFEHKEGIKFEDTFALIVKWATICLLLDLAAQQCWKLYKPCYSLNWIQYGIRYLYGTDTILHMGRVHTGRCILHPGIDCPGIAGLRLRAELLSIGIRG